MLYIIVIIILIVIIKILNKKINNMEINEKCENEIADYNKKYIKSEYLLTKNELKFYRILKQITDKLNYSLFCQVALYEIVKSINYKDFNKIRSKSIDFVITQENCKILLCIELDDETHNKTNRIERDKFINKLFEDLQIKLIRIPGQSYYNMEELENRIKESL